MNTDKDLDLGKIREKIEKKGLQCGFYDDTIVGHSRRHGRLPAR